MAKPIDDRTAVNAALDKFLQRQLQRTNGIVDWLQTAQQWRNPDDRGAINVGPFMARTNAERCEAKAEDMARRALAHVRRIRQLDASRRATAIADHHAAQHRAIKGNEPSASDLIAFARRAAACLPSVTHYRQAA